MKHTLFALSLAALLIASPLSAGDAEHQRLRLRWSEIAADMDGATATVYLRDGKHVNGKITGVSEVALTLQPGGDVPRTSVTQIRVKKMGKRGRLTSTAVTGTIAGIAGVAGAVTTGRGIGSLLILLSGGYLGGYAHDRYELLITIIP